MSERRNFGFIHRSIPAGYYALGTAGDVRFTLSRKPSWVKRFLMRHFLGFYWFDIKDEIHGA